MTRCLLPKSAAFIALPFSFCLLTAAMLCLAPSATAATKTWIDGTGSWDASANWSPSGQPQVGDDVYLTQSDATNRTVTYYNTTNPEAVLGLLKISATSTGTLTLDFSTGHDIHVTDINLGDRGQGAVTQSAGTITTGRLNICLYTDRQCTYTISGGTLVCTGTLDDVYVGSWGTGTGTLNVLNNGQIYCGNFNVAWGGPKGTVSVNGPGAGITASGWLEVGVRGPDVGEMSITNGAHVTSRSGIIGHYAGSNGTLVLDGQNSVWSSPLVVSVSVGQSGAGTLRIQNGALFSTADTISLAGYGGSSGTVMVDGIGSVCQVARSMYVGGRSTAAGGTGSLMVQNGGRVTVGGMLELWKADSTVTVSGGTLTAATIANNGALTVQAGGAVTVTGSMTNSGSLTVNDATLSASTITNTGIIRGRGDISGTITNNSGGIVAPGASPGILTVDAITFASGSTLQIELGGLARGTQYDTLAASGTITMQSGSTLAVTLIDGFVPRGDEVFDILDFAGRSGQFSTLSLPDLGGGLSWDTSDLYTTGTIMVAPEPASAVLFIGGLACAFLRRRAK